MAGDETEKHDARSGDAGPRGDARVIAALFGFALLVRIGAAAQIAVIFNDGPIFLEIAQQMAAGDWATAFAHQYHPLYPLVVAGVETFVPALEPAARIVSLVAGSLAVVALYLFLRRAFDRRVALTGGALLALHPYAAEFSADVQSEGLYIALFLAAVACLWRALALRSARAAVAAGAFAGLAYLVRPEGLGVVLAGFGVVGLRVAARKWSLLDGARFSAALGLGALLLVGPYVVHLHGLTGEWVLTQKKSLRQLTTPAEEAAPLPPGAPDRQRFRPPPGRAASAGAARRPGAREASLLPAMLPGLRPGATRGPAARDGFLPPALDALVDVVVVASGSLHLLFVLLVGFGVYLARGRPGERGVFLAILVAVYAVAVYGLTLNVGYLSRRHVLVPLLPLFGYAGLAVPVIGRALMRVVGLSADARGVRCAAVGLALVALITLPKTWSPQREERLATRRAAEWLAGREELVGPVAARKHRDAYYARRAFIDFARGGPHVEPARLQLAGARFLIIDDWQLERLPILRAERPTKFRELHRVEAGGRTGYVYEFVDAP